MTVVRQTFLYYYNSQILQISSKLNDFLKQENECIGASIIQRDVLRIINIMINKTIKSKNVLLFRLSIFDSLGLIPFNSIALIKGCT